jgi:hypothetical protein
MNTLLRLTALALLVSLPAPAWVQEGEKKPEEEKKQEDKPEICTKLTGCHKEHDKEKIDCPECGKSKIPKNDATCSTCASKLKRCAHCGLPRTANAGGGTIKDAFKIIAPADMQKILMQLASDEFEGRQTGSEGIKKARAFIMDTLKKWGVKEVEELPWGSCANIGAIYPGSDPKLKDEYVVVGSHYDHIGMGGQGKSGDNINNGADDNGSGSTTNMFIAKALAGSKIKLKRTVLHLWFSGEEQGLNGSRAYCDKPKIAMSSTVAMLNCDMLGRNPGRAAELFGCGSSPQFAAAIAKAQGLAPEANVKLIEGKGGYFDRSDQANFWAKGVPVMFIFTGLHADYHQPGDHPDKIDYNRMAALGRYMLTILVELANSDKKIEVNKEFK